MRVLYLRITGKKINESAVEMAGRVARLGGVSRSGFSAGISVFLWVSLGFVGVAGGQTVPQVVLRQATQLATLPGGWVISSGKFAGSEIAVNQQGNVFLGEPNGNDVVEIHGVTGVRTTVISGWGSSA